ncbi:MAG: protease modulator HflC [Planctomycetaceae bacterium]
MSQMRQQSILVGGLAGLLLLGIILAWSVLYTVSEREVAVVLQFGKPVEKRIEPGLYFKTPFIQEVRRLPKTLQFWQTREPVVDLLTADGEKIEVTAWAIWRINEPQNFVQVLRTVENAETSQIRVKVRAAIRDVIASHSLTDVVRDSSRELTYTYDSVLPDSGRDNNGPAPGPAPLQPNNQAVVAANPIGRTAILKEIKQRVEKDLKQTADGNPTARGIELVDVGISNISFVPTVRQAAFEKQKAFMESIASKHLNEGERLKQEILNRTQREVEQILGKGAETSTITRGEVDAEIIERYARAIEATGDFYKFTETLKLYETALQQDTRLILTTNSELFRMIKQLDPPPVKRANTPAAGN